MTNEPTLRVTDALNELDDCHIKSIKPCMWKY